MKKKILRIIGIIIFIISIISAFLTISNGTVEWFIEKDEEQGISWYYELVDGEAVNVRTTGGNAKYLTKLVVPSTLGGYPVTSLKGKDGTRWAYNATGVGNILETTPYSVFEESVHENNNLKEIVLPDTIKILKANCLDNLKALEKINIPASLEMIGWHAFANDTSLKELKFENPNNEFINMEYQAFEGSNIEKIVIDNIETWNHVLLGKTKKIEFGENVKNIKGQFLCEENADIQIPNTVLYFQNMAFTGATDIWVDNEEENVQVDFSKEPGKAWVHFNNKEKIETRLPEGIKAINAENNQEFITDKVATGGNFKFKLEQTEGYNYDKYTVIIEGYTKELDKTITKLDLRFGQEYTMENITRGKTIYVETRENKLDLNLRQYIWGVNDKELVHSRAPVVEQQEDRTIKYKHTKLPIYPKNENKIRLGIRVYNEGLVDGTADIITEYIPDGLKFDELSEINAQYGWVKSQDGKTATTNYLCDKNIESYLINDKIDYKEIFIELVVDTEESEEFKRLVTVAEISETSSDDTDSVAGNIVLPINSDFMQNESESSNTNSYIQCVEDDMDFESIELSRKVTRPYSLVLNKIDGIDNQLLNGATFDLMDENKNVLKTGVTANGGIIDFGTIYAYGDKKTRYYIKETYTPEGYKNHIQYLIRLDVVPPKEDLIQSEDLKFEIDMQSIDVDTSKYEEIEISTKEQLRAIESNKDKKYVLTQDIDLDGVEWEPLNVENVMLDGKGHKIKNLVINKSYETIQKIGLFSTFSGIIENLTIENADLKATKEMNITENEMNEQQIVEYLDELYKAESEENQIPAVGGIIGYSKNVILKNCKVTGNVKTEFKNAGGLVGHSKKGTITVFRNCTNEANIEAKKECTFNEYKSWYNNGWQEATVRTTVTEGRNAGGMIGTTLGPVYVSNSVNKGNIYAGRYNAGGMIGTAEENEYTLNNVFGKYNDNLNIYVKNERINGNYNIKIKKVDETGKNILEGAKFSVYDRNKNVIEGFENIELTNGILELPEKILSIGTDTFYIKETEAPSGYVRLTDTYIKVEVEKTWNKEQQKYETKVETKTLTPTEMQNDIPKEKNTSTVASGANIDNTENQNIVLKTNDVTLDENSINEGNVTTGCLNAGGFVGRATCSVEAVDVRNLGDITTSIGNTSGIVAQIDIADGKNGLLFVKNAINEGKIKQENNNSISYAMESNNYSAAGIAGTVNSDVEIYNTINNGIIEAEAINMSGILASAFSDYLIIDNCSNNNIIKTTKDEFSNGSNSAGILGQVQNHHKLSEEPTWSSELYTYVYNSENEHLKYIISNCTNKANIEFVGNAGGIISTSYAKDLQVKGCKCEDTEFINKGYCYYEGGIIGKTNNENLTIEECSIKNVELNSDSADAIGGILGGYGFNSRVNADTKLGIKDCEVVNSKISAIKEAGGIVAEIYFGNIITVENCKVENTEIKAKNDSAGGIIGSTNGESSESKITINNCEVKDGNIIIQAIGSYSPSAAGIITKAYNYNIEIDKCNVSNTEIENRANAHDGNNTGGIIAFSNGKNTSIKNTNVKHTKLKSNSKIGGIAGIIGINGENAIIDNCHVKGSTIEDLEQANSNTSGIIGGLIAYLTSRDSTVTNCSVDILTNEEMLELGITNPEENVSKIKANKEKCSGAIGYLARRSTIQNITVKNTTIEANSNILDNAYATFGGFIQCIDSSANDVIIEDCQIVDSTVTVKGYQVSGFVGVSNANITLKRCIVNHSTIENNGQFDNDNYQASTAGIIGIGTGTTTIQDCAVINNSKVSSTLGSVSGIVGTGNGTILGCRFEDSIIEKKNNNSNPEGTIRNVSGITDNFNTNEIKNCTVKNATLISNCDHVSGITGNLTINSIKNCTVENIIIKIYNNVSASKIINIGGIKATNSSNVTLENSTVNNIKVEKVDKDEPKDINLIRVGGLFGYSEGNITLNNNNISNITIDMEKSSNAQEIGGLIGLNKQKVAYKEVNGTWKDVADDNETVINGLNIASVNIKGGRHVGGLIGDGKRIILTNAKIIDLNINTSNSSSIVGGLIGRAQTDINNGIRFESKVTLNNIEIGATEGNTNKIYGGKVGALVGIADDISMPEEGNENKIIVNNTKVEATSDIAGLLGLVNEINNFKNITINNFESKSNGTSAGFIGILWNTRENLFDNIVLNNTHIIGKNNTGGLIGIIPNGNAKTTLKNVTVNNLFVDCSEAVSNANVGGLIGLARTLELDTINVTDLKIVHNNSYNTGGLVGIITNVESELKNININATTGKINEIIATTNNNNNYSNIGIILGFGTKINTSNINIKDTSLEGGINQSIGTFGNVDYESNIAGVNLDNVTITGEGSSSKGYIGGIVGFIKGKVSSCTVKNSNISSTDKEHNKVGENYNIGGIVGAMAVGSSTTSKIDNCVVEKTNITGEHGYVGGIAGLSNNLIINSTIKNSNVINTGDTGTATGGILGHGSNVSGLDTSINNCKVVDTSVTGNNKVGGITGGAVHNIENCYIGKAEEENIQEGQYAVTIKGKDSVGAIIGSAGELKSDNYLILEMRNNNVNNTLIIRNTTEGEQISNIDKMIGTHNTFKEEYTGTREEVLENNIIDEYSIIKNEE